MPPLNPEELAALERLVSSVRDAAAAANALIPRLAESAEEESPRLDVADRLRCVLQDSLRPALRDLLVLHVEAQGGEIA
jgi:Mg2+ and Co2+ transporter CorA